MEAEAHLTPSSRKSSGSDMDTSHARSRIAGIRPHMTPQPDLDQPGASEAKQAVSKRPSFKSVECLDTLDRPLTSLP